LRMLKPLLVRDGCSKAQYVAVVERRCHGAGI
jgi:hypothetical protein